MPLQYVQTSRPRRKFFVAFIFLTIITNGVIAKNNRLPRTDGLTGAKTRWFGFSAGREYCEQFEPFRTALTNSHSTTFERVHLRRLAASRRQGCERECCTSADLAVWRPSKGTWWVMGGANSANVMQYSGMSVYRFTSSDSNVNLQLPAL